MKKYIATLLFVGMAPWTLLNAQSQTTDTTFQVKARVDAVCSVSASDLDFGTYTSASGTATQGTTILKATCTPATTYNIGLNAGTSSGATVQSRKMTSGTNTLGYQLYSDSGRQIVWGETSGTDTVAGTGTGLPIDHTVYGSITAAQNIAAGDYSDTITVRIYY
jgi:spore coat protein U-like protein